MSARWLMTTGSKGLVVTIPQAARRPNVRALAIAQGWNLTDPFTLVIESGVDVANIALLSSDIPNDKLTLVNYGRIGGIAGGQNDGDGIGLFTNTRIRLANYGEIFGAGGRGGSGATASCYYYTVSPQNFITSAGGSFGSGQGFHATSALSGKTIPIVAKTNGSAGFYISYTGGIFGGTTAAYCRGGTGGAGADIGQQGTTGFSNVEYGGTYVSPSTSSPGVGEASIAVSGVSLITFLNTGLITGNMV